MSKIITRRRVLSSLAVVVYIAICIWYIGATISGTTQWEVRTTGSDTNGGFYDTGGTSCGTDYSQQDSPQVTYTDLVIGSTNTQLTSAAFPFTSLHVCNGVNITGGTGFTTGRYLINSISGSTVTLDRAVGTANSTGGAGKLGGSLATLDPFFTQQATGSSISAGATVHLKAGTYTRTTTATASNGSWQIVGYGSTHWDNGTRPLITTSTNSTALFSIGGGGYQIFRNVSFSNTASTRSYGVKSGAGGAYNYITLIHCKFDGFSWGVITDNSLVSAGYIMLNDTEILNGTLGGTSAWFTLVVHKSYIHDNSGPGIQKTASQNDAGFDLSESVVARNTHGVDIEASNLNCHFFHNDFVANTSDGVFVYSGATNEYMTMQDNIAYGNTGYGFNWSSATAAFDFAMNSHNAWGGNTTADVHNYTKNLDGTDISGITDPFVSSATGDFRLNNVSTGGTLLRGTASANTFPGGSTAFWDIGAIQTSGAAVTTTHASSN